MAFAARSIRKKVFILCVLFMFVSITNGQNNTQRVADDFWTYVHFGGGLGLSFGDGFFSGTIAPSAIYEVNDFVALGLGLNATFNKRKNFYKSTILGGSFISLFNPLVELQLSAEFEELNVNRVYDNNLDLEDDNYWYPALFLGAGYRSGNITFGIRYDVLYDKDDSIYADPWAPFVRVYF